MFHWQKVRIVMKNLCKLGKNNFSLLGCTCGFVRFSGCSGSLAR